MMEILECIDGQKHKLVIFLLIYFTFNTIFTKNGAFFACSFKETEHPHNCANTL